MNSMGLDSKLREIPEIEVMRLLSCGFDKATFSLIRNSLPDNLVTLVELSMKHASVLTNETSSLDSLISELEQAESASGTFVPTSAIRLLGYSGVSLSNSDRLMSTLDKLVSYNEQHYYLSVYPWATKPVNPILADLVTSDDSVFYYTSDFDISKLDRMIDIKEIKNNKIYTTGGLRITMKEV